MQLQLSGKMTTGQQSSVARSSKDCLCAGTRDTPSGVVLLANGSAQSVQVGAVGQDDAGARVSVWVCVVERGEVTRNPWLCTRTLVLVPGQ